MADEQAVNDPNPDNKEATHQTSILLETPAIPPVVPPVVAPVVADESAVEYEATGDVGLDMALAFVGKAGIGNSHPAMVAAINGDFTILKATLAAKGTPGWEQFVALGEAAFARTSADTEKKATESRAAVIKEAGGEESWKAVQAWAGANATPEEKAQINALLNQGGLAAKGAVRYLLDVYQRANNVEVNPRDALANAGRQAGAPAAGQGALSPREYSEAVGALNSKLNGRLEGSREYEALQRRRAMYQG